jgi:hypothetical protein
LSNGSRTWETYCHEFPDGRLAHFGEPRYVSLHGNHPIVKVLLTEDATGGFMGWLAKDETEISRVQVKRLFDMAFHEGYKVAEEQGRGKAYPIRVEKVEAYEN